MKNEKDNHLDKVFQEGLGDPVEARYREQDWNALEQMLGKSKKRGGALFWLPALSSAALILVLFGWWLLRPRLVQSRQDKQQSQLAAHQVKHRDTANRQVAGNQVAIKQPSVIARKNEPLNPPGGGLQTVAVIHTVTNTGILNADTAAGNFVAGPISKTNSDNELTAVSLDLGDPELELSQPASPVNNLLPASIPSTTPGIPVPKRKITTKRGLGANPQYALNVLGAPELNGVNSLQQTRSGTNFGVLFSVGLFKKLTISTGGQYSNKPYNSYFNYYNKPSISDLTSINANCRVLDIPLNLDYQLFGSYRNKFSIGTGLSSYIMLHESYQYNYANNPSESPVTYTVPNTNKYLFDILNIQATYTRQVNSKVGVTFTPYVKLPLTGIGANQARLQTTGIALGLNWNLNSLYRP
jgi:hypothetical protein